MFREEDVLVRLTLEALPAVSVAFCVKPDPAGGKPHLSAYGFRGGECFPADAKAMEEVFRPRIGAVEGSPDWHALRIEPVPQVVFFAFRGDGKPPRCRTEFGAQGTGTLRSVHVLGRTDFKVELRGEGRGKPMAPVRFQVDPSFKEQVRASFSR